MEDNKSHKPNRNAEIWRERKEQGTTLEALAQKYGLTRERIRQIVAKRDRQIRFEEFKAQVAAQRQQEQAEANHGG